MAIKHNNDIHVVMEANHRTPGKGQASMQTVLRNLRSGSSAAVKFSASEKVDVVPLHSEKMEFSYFDGTDYVFSHPETYETVTISAGLVGKDKDYLIENIMVNVMTCEEKVIQIELPANVVMEVTSAPEGVKGDSTSNVYKAAEMETGITVQVPLFIKNGEKIKIDTRTGKYMERA